MSPYLTVSDAAELLGVSAQTVRRRVYAGQLPALWLTSRLIRLPARALVDSAPPPVPWTAAAVSAPALAEAWQLHVRTVRELAAAGRLPGRMRQGQWTFSRSALERTVARLTTGRAAA